MNNQWTAVVLTFVKPPALHTPSSSLEQHPVSSGSLPARVSGVAAWWPSARGHRRRWAASGWPRRPGRSSACSARSPPCPGCCTGSSPPRLLLQEEHETINSPPSDRELPLWWFSVWVHSHMQSTHRQGHYRTIFWLFFTFQNKENPAVTGVIKLMMSLFHW